MAATPAVPKRLRDQIRKHVRTEMRYRVEDSVLDGLILAALRDGEPDYPEISKERFIFAFIRQYLDKHFSHAKRAAMAQTESSADPYHPDSLRNLLMPAIKTLEAVEDLGSVINEKVDLLRTQAHNRILADIFRYAYDPMIAFGVGDAFQVDLKAVSTGGNPYTEWAHFIELLQFFASKPAVDHEGKRQLRECLGALPRMARKWADRVLRRDLKIGMQDGNIRRVWPKLIPTFDVALCNTIKRGDGLAAALDTLPSRLWVEPKYDGLRSLVIVRDAQKGHARVHSRKGLVDDHLDYLAQEAIALFCAIGRQSGVLDCEAVAKDSTLYSDAVSARNTQDLESRPLRMMVFDLLTLEGFESGEESAPHLMRRKALVDLFEHHQDQAPSFRVAPGAAVGTEDRTARILALFAKWRERGYEGVVIKDRNAGYASGERARKRSGYWRIKPFETLDVVITGAFEGKAGSKYEGMLGGFHCRLPNGVDIRVGGGFSDEQRRSFWAKRKKLVGRAIEIERQEDTPGIKTRHAFFKRLREKGDK